MGISIRDWFLGKKPKDAISVACQALVDAATELKVRELAFGACVNMIANAVGRCEFQTFVDGRPVKGREYYLWNVEPNINQNSTQFLHDIVDALYRKNEVLIVSTKHQDGHEMLVVADSYDPPSRYPAKMNIYKNVTVGEVTYRKSFPENEVMRLRLNSQDIKPVIDGLYGSYQKLLQAAERCYTWKSGVHLKVKVDQTAEADDKFEEIFQSLMTAQVKPWMENGFAVLPEFNGYSYSNDLSDKGTGQQNTRDIRALISDIFDFTAMGFCIPPVLVKGEVAGAEDAKQRFLTFCVDTFTDQLQEEANRKRYGFDAWSKGNYLQIDTSRIMHFDMFQNAGNIEKLIGSGAYSINDVLDAAGRPRIAEPWADQHWLTLNIGTMENAARAAENAGKEESV